MNPYAEGFRRGAIASGLLMLVLSAGLWLLYLGKAEGAIDEARRTYAQAKTIVRVDSVEVVKAVTRVRTLRDTFNFRDTLQVVEYIERTDTLIQRCLACTASASALGVAADTVILRVGADRRRWYDRIGISAGYGVLLDRDGSVRHGPTFGVSVRIVP